MITMNLKVAFSSVRYKENNVSLGKEFSLDRGDLTEEQFKEKMNKELEAITNLAWALVNSNSEIILQ